MTLDQPRLSCRMIEEFRSIEITIENPSKWDLIFTDRIGFVHARVFGGEEKGDHLIDDGFNMDLSRLNATDLTTVAAGAKFTFTRACRDGEFRRITAKDDIKVFIDPVTIDSFKLDEQPKVKGFVAGLRN